MIIHEMLSSLDIHLLSAGHACSGKEWNYSGVNNFFNRLYYVVDGEASVSHHGRNYQLTPGTLHLVPCYNSTDYLCNSSFDHYYITFTSRAFGGVDICTIQEYDYQRAACELDRTFFSQLLKLNPACELPVADPAISIYREYHEKQQHAYHNKSPQLHLENMSYISLLLSPFLATGKNSGSDVHALRLFTFLRYVEEQLHQPISIKDIANHLEMTPNYLSDWLDLHFRMRPIEYINRRRCEEAQQQLITTSKSIKELSFSLGFSSTSYFCRVFKKQVGVSAARYRSLYL